MSDPDAAAAPPRSTLLVVDGEVLVRTVLAAYLRDCGYRVLEASNGQEAMILLQQDALPVGVVLADVALPGEMDGFTLSRWARHHRPGVEVLLAGTPARAAEEAADLCEEGPTLARPYEPQMVVDRIKRLLASRGE